MKQRLQNVDFVRKAFDSFDVDKSGFLDPQELRAALTMLGVKPSIDALKEMGIEDRDGDGTLSLMDLDTDGDQKIDFEEFKCLAAILPKRDHAIYRGALSCDPIVVPKAAPGQEAKLTPVQRDRLEAQEKTKAALNGALARLRKKMRLTDDKMLKDSVLLRKFNEVHAEPSPPQPDGERAAHIEARPVPCSPPPTIFETRADPPAHATSTHIQCIHTRAPGRAAGQHGRRSRRPEGARGVPAARDAGSDEAGCVAHHELCGHEQRQSDDL